MKVIAESSSIRTEWVLCDGPVIIEQAITTGLNPYYQTRREMSRAIRLELPDVFFKRRWDHIYFYGSGCALPERRKLVETSIVAQFKTPCTVETDILGAARGALRDKPGLVCLLRTGSNSCMYDGKNIVKNVNGLGFILGDEGSNAHIGKLFVSDVLKGITPREIARAFYERFHLSDHTLMDSVYDAKVPSQALAKYTFFLKEYINDPYVHQLVYDSFMSFFKRNVSAYEYSTYPISFVGTAATMFEDILREVAADFGATISNVALNTMNGLIEYHSL